MQFEEFESFDTVSTAPVATAAASPLVRLQYLIDNTPAIIYSTVPSGDFQMTFVSNNAYNGLALAIVRTRAGAGGKLILTASADGLEATQVTLDSQ